jgi:hypothetical protein
MIYLIGITKINYYKKNEPIIFNYIKLDKTKLAFSDVHEMYRFICSREEKYKCIIHPRTIEK